MRVLFDHGTPAPIRTFLEGHVITRTQELGWDRLTNGELLTAAEDEGFDLLLTTDKNIRHQQVLVGRKIAIVVQKSLMRAKRMNISDTEKLARTTYTAGKCEYPLADAFFRKLQSKVTQAKDQIQTHDLRGETLHIVYISICFDEAVGFNRLDELRQVARYLNDNPTPGTRVVYGTWD
jgi:hypothetical protein